MNELIYVAGSYSNGDAAENIRNAVRIGDELLARGHIPFIPHLSHLWHLMSPKPYEEWMKYDMAMLERCDALFLLNNSPGANRELRRAEKLGKVIYRSLEEVPNAH